MGISTLDKKKFVSFGKVLEIKEIDRGIELYLENGRGKILIYSASLIRFIFTRNKEYGLDHSYAVIKPLEEWPIASFDHEKKSSSLLIRTSELTLEIIKAPLKIIVKDANNEEITYFEDDEEGFGACYSDMSDNIRSYKKIRSKDHFFGFGEKTGPLDKKGELMVMDGHDMPYKGNAEPLYQNHPFFITINSQMGLASGIFLDNISKTTFDMGKTDKDYYYFDAASGDLNYYFIKGPSINEILEKYTELTGHMEMPPKWAIGYQQCKYSYKDEEEIRDITSKFREHHVPCDCIWFDIHYMDGYRVFTFNNKRFPDSKGLLDDLKTDGFHPICIVDPGVKVDENFDIYQELIEKEYYVKRKNGEPSEGLVWPGLTVFPDFTRPEVRDWWAEKHQFYFEIGMEGIWNDMNEPALSINPVLSTLKRMPLKDMTFWDQGRNTPYAHGKNVYALCEAEATFNAFKKFRPNKRPFVLTRSGYSGIQRYAAIWTGDNWTDWHNISLAIRMLLNLNLSAQSFVGSDVGGFAGIIKVLVHDKKQFIRWIQTGVFYPFCRVHSANGMRPQDPFSYGKVAQQIATKYINLRYQLLPYWYTLFRDYHEKGMPIIRPLFYHTPKDEICYERQYHDQFFLGEDILIIPIDKRNLKKKLIYLPGGEWIDYWNLKEYKGNQEHLISLTLKDMPIFIRKGAIIPFQPVVEHVGQQDMEILTLKIYKGDDNTDFSTKIYEDDGDTMQYSKNDEFCVLNIHCEYKVTDSVLSLKLEGKYDPPWKIISYEVYDQGELSLSDSVDFKKEEMRIVF